MSARVIESSRSDFEDLIDMRYDDPQDVIFAMYEAARRAVIIALPKGQPRPPGRITVRYEVTLDD